MPANRNDAEMERLERDKRGRGQGVGVADALKALAAKWQPDGDERLPDQIIGYDDDGLPR